MRKRPVNKPVFTFGGRLLATKHPAEIDYLACSDLQRLNKAIGTIRRELTFVTQDLTRIDKYKKEVIYLLDFSDLHGYLWPESSTSQYKVTSRYLLTSSDLKFSLPPGAIRELIYHLSSKASEHRRIRESILTVLEKPLVKFFLKSYDFQVDKTDDREALSSSVLNEILQSIRGLSEFDTAISRLIGLYDSKRLSALSSYIDPSTASPDLSVLNDAYFQLSSERPAKGESVNYADAHNYAFAYGLNNKYYETSKYFFLLVTSSPIPYRVFDSIKWNEDPLFKTDPGSLLRTSLVRNPVQLLYQTHISAQRFTGRRQLRNLNQDLQVLHEEWDRIKDYRRYVQEKNIPGSTPVKLPTNRRYRKHLSRFWNFYQDIFRPVAELVATDAAQEQNRRMLRGIDSAGVVGLRLAADLTGSRESEALPSLTDYRTILPLFDRLLNLTQSEVQRAKRSLQEIGRKAIADLDVEGLIIEPDRIQFAVNFNQNVDCREVTAYLTRPSEERSIFFCADKYDDFTAFWWRTSSDISEFLKACRHYVRSAAKWNSLQNAEEVNDRRSKQYDGVYFYLDNDIKSFRLEEIEHHLTDSPLHDTLLNLCEPHWNVRFLRLGLEHGDLCYDFEPIEAFPQRAGLITHLQCVEGISDLIQWTNIKYVQKRAIVRAVQRVFDSNNLIRTANTRR